MTQKIKTRLFAGCLLVAAGCDVAPSTEDLGKIEFRVPEPSEIGDGYQLPDLSGGAEGDSVPKSDASAAAEDKS